MIVKVENSIPEYVKDLYESSFNDEERLPNNFLIDCIKRKECELFTYFDDFKKSFIGFTFSFLKNDFVYLAYFATSNNIRNQGYGASILEKYINSCYKDKIVCLNAEIPTKNAKEDDIKFRRINFYKRNGFIEVPLLMIYKESKYITLSSKNLSSTQIKNLSLFFKDYECEYQLL